MRPGSLLADAHDSRRYWGSGPGALLADAHDALRYCGVPS